MTIARLSTSSLNKGPSKKRSVLAGNDPILSGAFESIATVTVGAGGASSVSFTSIPSTYKHLQIRFLAKTSRSDNQNDYVYVRFNSDSGTNYASHRVSGQGSTANAYAITSQAQGFAGFVASDYTAQVDSNVFGAGVTDILDYANTNKYKTVRALSGDDYNGGGFIGLFSSLWQSTSAITSITLYGADPGSWNWKQYSTFALYGIR